VFVGRILPHYIGNGWIDAFSCLSRFEALRSGATPLVGRDEELELLIRRWEQAKSQRLRRSAAERRRNPPRVRADFLRRTGIPVKRCFEIARCRRAHCRLIRSDLSPSSMTRSARRARLRLCRARNCDVSQLTIPANELCEPPGPGDGIGYSSFSACCRSHSTLPMA
jgi:hypothetical protein